MACKIQLIQYDILAFGSIRYTAARKFYHNATVSCGRLNGMAHDDPNKRKISNNYIFAMESMLEQVELFEAQPSFQADFRDDETVLCKYYETIYYIFIEMT